MKLKAHIFICTNERASGHPRGCCKDQGSEELVKAFKQELAQVGLNKEIRAQKAGCLDVCEYGATVVIYPDTTWYGKVTITDVPEIVRSHLIEGQPLERLRIIGK